jgi:pimeloyl-ACP methyl ester carboxylesterase
VKAAPAARALAKKLGVDLESMVGSGPGGRITVEDVERSGSAEPVLSIDAEGSGPPLLLISGFGVDKTSWRRQIDALQKNFTAVSYDPRGVGASRPMPTDSLTIAAMAECWTRRRVHRSQLSARARCRNAIDRPGTALAVAAPS